MDKTQLQQSSRRIEEIKNQLCKTIKGEEKTIERVILTFLTGGHALIEGPPGTAKTLMIRILSRVVDVSFRRIQFTPDLMPSDIIGTNVFNMKTSSFNFRKGPIFTDILLADEINRAPAKTQSALLECMEEKTATVDGERYEISPVFSVFATQNPIEFEGTYPLPEAQLDRFLMKINVNFPHPSSEMEILKLHEEGFDPSSIENIPVKKVISKSEIPSLRKSLNMPAINDKVRDYIVKIIQKTRNHPSILVGSSPRGAIALMKVSKALACMEGRDYVIPDDVRGCVHEILQHRIILRPEVQIEGACPADVISEIIASIPVPM